MPLVLGSPRLGLSKARTDLNREAVEAWPSIPLTPIVRNIEPQESGHRYWLAGKRMERIFDALHRLDFERHYLPKLALNQNLRS